ncbi:MAG: biotin/lipoyl-binding protein [Ruminococcaceae bacterium]|nr:biotin/lipoyl-binding protein [Oscillospiraceae bacterium]
MKNYRVTVNGVAYDVSVEEIEGNTPVAVSAVPKVAPAAPKAAPAAPAASVPAGANTVKAPMPGNILKVAVKAGDSVKKGALLCVLEAMKMENEILAPADGTIDTVAVAPGATVATDAVLVTYH